MSVQWSTPHCHVLHLRRNTWHAAATKSERRLQQASSCLDSSSPTWNLADICTKPLGKAAFNLLLNDCVFRRPKHIDQLNDSERMVDLFDIVDRLVGIIAPAVLVLVAQWCWDRVVRSRTFRATCHPPVAPMPDRDAGHRYSEPLKSTVKEPPVFTGAAPDFRQWVFSIELAMRALRLSAPADMVTYASSFLAGNAQL